MQQPHSSPRLAVDRAALYALRAALIQALNAVEDALRLPRSVPSRRERQREAGEAGERNQDTTGPLLRP